MLQPVDYVNIPAPVKPNHNDLAKTVLGMIVGSAFLLTCIALMSYQWPMPSCY